MPANVATNKPPAFQSDNQSLIQDFLKSVKDTRDAASYDSKHYGSWNEDSSRLLTTSTIHSFSIGTGAEIVESICPAIEHAKSKVVIVTCFWAKSTSQRRLAAAILHLAQKAQREHRLVNVRLCLSSLSLWQKLTQTSSLNGHIYPSSTWSTTFGLPRCDDLLKDGHGVHLTIKSIFVRPMSVMHPKFIIIDQARLFLPSCNISWEDWFEGMIELSGSIINSFLDFHRSFWEGRPHSPAQQQAVTSPIAPPSRPISTLHVTTQALTFSEARTLFLPSPHHVNPRFRPFPCMSAPQPPPSTPLNTFLLHLFAHAAHTIHIQTPNLTSPPVLAALRDALQRGVAVSVVTSTRMMMLEQVVTAGTVTEVCVHKLRRRYRSLLRSWRRRRRGGGEVDEAAAMRPGRLSVRYFTPSSDGGAAAGAVKSHLKMTVVDGEVVVLGSGNMDRASWYTSQEIGVAVFGREVVGMIRGKVEEALKGRVGREMVEQLEREDG